MTLAALVEYLQIELDKQNVALGQLFINNELEYFLKELYCNFIRRVAEKFGRDKISTDEVNLLSTESTADTTNPKTILDNSYLLGAFLNSPRLECTEISEDNSHRFLTTTSNLSPYIPSPVYCVTGKKVTLYSGETAPSWGYKSILQLDPLNVTDIPNWLASRVIEEAALILINNMESERFLGMNLITQNNPA